MKTHLAVCCLLLASSLPSFAWLGQTEHDCIYSDHWGVPLGEDNAGTRVVRTCFNPKDNIIVFYLDGKSVSETLIKPSGSFTRADVNHFLAEERDAQAWKGPESGADGLVWTGGDRTAIWNKGNTVVIKCTGSDTAEKIVADAGLKPVVFP